MNTIPMLLDSKNLTSVHWNGINRDNPITTLKKYKPTSINVNVIIVICNVAFYFGTFFLIKITKNNLFKILILIKIILYEIDHILLN